MIASATADPRFTPVTADELPGLTIEISALDPLLPIEPRDIVLGRHGLMITGERGSALLLPQVALALDWDRREFLEKLCEKAGLDQDAWTAQDLRLYGFEADTWEEDSRE